MRNIRLVIISPDHVTRQIMWLPEPPSDYVCICATLCYLLRDRRGREQCNHREDPKWYPTSGTKENNKCGASTTLFMQSHYCHKKMWSLVTRNADWRKRIKHSWFLLFQIWTFTDVVKGPQAGASFGISSRYKRHAGCEIGHSAPSGSYHAVPSYTLHIKIQKKERKTHEDQSSSRHILHDFSSLLKLV